MDTSAVNMLVVIEFNMFPYHSRTLHPQCRPSSALLNWTRKHVHTDAGGGEERETDVEGGRGMETGMGMGMFVGGSSVLFSFFLMRVERDARREKLVGERMDGVRSHA